MFIFFISPVFSMFPDTLESFLKEIYLDASGSESGNFLLGRPI